MRKLFIVSWLISLCACTTFTPPASNQLMTRAVRIQTLQHFTHWLQSGAIAIRTPKQSTSAHYALEYAPTHFQLELSGPFGAQTTQLKGNQQWAMLTDAKGRRYQAASAEQLLSQHFGWFLPLRDLPHWLKGLTAPGPITEQTLDRFNHLTTLKQAGWTLHYLRYSHFAGLDLPAKILLQHDNLIVKIIIKQWTNHT